MMEREIAFRGKSKSTGEWVDGYYVGDNTIIAYNEVVYDMGFIDTSPCHDCYPGSIGQFTGLYDKNGKEIYEGDILRGDEYPFNCDGVDNYFAEIVWADNVCGFYRITHKKPNSTVRGISHGNWEQLDEDDIKSFEVIGNIHDNPELLKDGRD